MKPSKPYELFSIQYLRAAAALMVVLYHGFSTAQRHGAPQLPIDWLAYGVDIFFVISGCIMWITTVERPAGPLKFWWKRIVRIVPLYWLMTAVLVAGVLIAPSLFNTARFDLGHVVSSFLFLAHHHPTRPTFEPILIQGWTLNLEMFFYLIFGFALLIGPKTVRLAAMLAVLAGLTVFGLFVPSDSLIGFYTQPLLVEFAFGVALGAAFTSARLKLPFGGLAMILGFVLIPVLAVWAPGLPHLWATGLPAALIIAGALSLETQRKVGSLPLLALLGDASYSIYLSHPLVQAVIIAVWAKLLPTHSLAGAFAFTAVALVVCSVAGVVIYWVVEKPIMNLARRRRSPAQGEPALVAAPVSSAPADRP